MIADFMPAAVPRAVLVEITAPSKLAVADFETLNLPKSGKRTSAPPQG
jgi:hypothetical protein